MINRDNEMLLVSVIETHASIEDQNMDTDTPIDEGRVHLHESAHEVDKETNCMKQ
ncbi:hypothetical protein RHMOL_Rhmol01G0369000 [Rhododendron molle]|uniref:Uncharacterized protein n=1 Tax=Rhododendron molle TaxID=49168 RepID=A0ACC0Q999_RHOML|nr:hypothetical protein RHMOL_Rhmol01G0369000 [Rhododendron molle]